MNQQADSATVDQPEDGRSEQELFDEFYEQEQRQAGVDALKREIELMETQVSLGEAFKRLEQNEDFQFVIERGYVEEVPRRMTRFLGGNIDEHSRADAQMSISAVGVFQCHLEGIMQLALKAKMELPMTKANLAEMDAQQ